MEKVIVELSNKFSIEGDFDRENGKITFTNNGKLLIVEKETEVAHSILTFRINQAITNLYKQFLIITEDIQSEYSAAMLRLLDSLPEEEKPKLIQADFFDQEKFQYLRNKILDYGNNTIRNLESELTNYQFTFNIEERSNNEKT